MNHSLPGNTYEPVIVSRQLRINADLIMDEISAHVDKELDRFSCGVEYMKKSMKKNKKDITEHVDDELRRFTRQVETIRHPGYWE